MCDVSTLFGLTSRVSTEAFPRFLQWDLCDLSEVLKKCQNLKNFDRKTCKTFELRLNAAAIIPDQKTLSDNIAYIYDVEDIVEKNDELLKKKEIEIVEEVLLREQYEEELSHLKAKTSTVDGTEKEISKDITPIPKGRGRPKKIAVIPANQVETMGRGKRKIIRKRISDEFTNLSNHINDEGTTENIVAAINLEDFNVVSFENWSPEQKLVSKPVFHEFKINKKYGAVRKAIDKNCLKNIVILCRNFGSNVIIWDDGVPYHCVKISDLLPLVNDEAIGDEVVDSWGVILVRQLGKLSKKCMLFDSNLWSYVHKPDVHHQLLLLKFHEKVANFLEYEYLVFPILLKVMPRILCMEPQTILSCTCSMYKKKMVVL